MAILDRTVLVGDLSRLYVFEADAAEAYATAAPHLPRGALREELALFAAEHGRHRDLLHGQLAGLGFDPPERTGALRGLSLDAPGTTPVGPAAVLAATLGNEQLAGSLYAKALARELPRELRAVLVRVLAEERRHLAWARRALAARAAQR